MPTTPRYTSVQKGSSTSVFHSIMQQQRTVMYGEPYGIPTQYRRSFYSRSRTNAENGLWRSALNNLIAADPAVLPALDSARAKAFDKFVEDSTNSASLSLMVAERKEAFSMIASRASQIYKGYRNLRKGRFRDFLGTFGVKALPKHANKRWSRPRDAAGLWLEYSFGWSPTIDDIGSAVEILQSPYPFDVKIKGASRSPFQSSGESGAGSSTRTWESAGTVGARYQAYATVTNPDLYRANQLGFVNPLSVIWELVPFSFVVDWFLPVGKFLSDFSNFAGLSLSKSFNTWKIDLVGSGSWKEYSTYFTANEEYYEFGRNVGLNFDRKFFPTNFGTSAKRAANAIALVVSIFSPSRR